MGKKKYTFWIITKNAVGITLVIFDLQTTYSLIILLYIELSNSFLIGRKRTVNFRNQRP